MAYGLSAWLLTDCEGLMSVFERVDMDLYFQAGFNDIFEGSNESYKEGWCEANQEVNPFEPSKWINPSALNWHLHGPQINQIDLD